ncbi:hypothetical protein B5X24_HaOG209627 [Helicoverpa armigera]|nr:hypothetical protein B5X24_HaOG209627 [Helicoverpa armigera]
MISHLTNALRYWPARCSKAGPVSLCGRHPAATANSTKRGARNTTPPSRGLLLIGRQTPLVYRPQASPYGGRRSATLRRPPRLLRAGREEAVSLSLSAASFKTITSSQKEATAFHPSSLPTMQAVA